ncbi:hypothetical protein [Bacillus sp. EAC]|uniref:hypothetical protein n=1 Tax=Bacillus sp. EAC TaxID=1978338 RepID=UPI000B4427A7|nr:hypothetical protein [Bacillus sp. EAC]
MKKTIGAIYVLVSLIMFFTIPIIDALCTAISIANSIGAGNFVNFEGLLLWVPIITFVIGLTLLFGKETNAWFNPSDK